MMTFLLLLINGFVFYLLEQAGGSTDRLVLLVYGAKWGPYITQYGQWWRLVTAAFIHIGWQHLLMNSLSLLSLGPVLERRFGKGRLLLLYLVSGIGGNLLSLWKAPMVLSAGASTALYGFMGALLVSGRINPGILIFNLALGFLNPQLDSWGHLGGFLSGIILTFLFRLVEKRR